MRHKRGKVGQPTAEVRQICAERDNDSCVVCGRSLYNCAASLHHRLMRSQGAGYPGLHRPGNLIWVCGSGTSGCHNRIHANPEWAYEHGYLVHPWLNPLSVPVDTWQHGRVLLRENGGYKQV